ncbi:MAG: hypothetical protein V1855_01405, partial [bacterium]
SYAARHHATGKYMLYQGKILLFDPKNNKYMCSLLDACLYAEKLKTAGYCATVLDQQYSAQQKATLTILKKLSHDVSSIIPIFYHTPNAVLHGSVQTKNVYSEDYPTWSNGQNSRPSISVFELISALTMLGQISKRINVQTQIGSLDLKVLQNVIPIEMR